MWQAQLTDEGDADRITLSCDGESLIFQKLFELLRISSEFRSWYTELLAGSRFDAFYWEHPCLTLTRLQQAVEFVLIDAPMLARLPADPTPFRSYFAGDPGSVVAFPNLGGDALLVVPTPGANGRGFAHLAACLRGASAAQIQVLWRQLGAEL